MMLEDAPTKGHIRFTRSDGSLRKFAYQYLTPEEKATLKEGNIEKAKELDAEWADRVERMNPELSKQ